MAQNKFQPTNESVEAFVRSLSERRQNEANVLIGIMKEISGEPPVLWYPGIIGFGSQHYTYDTGREGDMPRLAFSPRKAALTVYFEKGFADRYGSLLAKLGKHKTSAVCLYITKLDDSDLKVLRQMLAESYQPES